MFESLQAETRVGLKWSFMMHGAIFLVFLLDLAGLINLTPEPEPMPDVVTVEILPITDVTNVKMAPKQPEPPKMQPKAQPAPPTPPKPVAEPKPKDAPKPTPVEALTAKAEDIPLPKPEEKPVPKPEKPKPQPKEKPKVQEKPKEKPKPAKPQASLEEVLKNLQAKAAQPTVMTEEQHQQAYSRTPTNYDASKPLSMSEMDAIRQQLKRCWRMPAGMRDAHTLIVKLQLQLGIDGAVQDVQIDQMMRYRTDPAFRAAADSAVRAVRKCSPLQGLPQDNYGAWRDMEMTFDPRDLL